MSHTNQSVLVKLLKTGKKSIIDSHFEALQRDSHQTLQTVMKNQKYFSPVLVSSFSHFSSKILPYRNKNSLSKYAELAGVYPRTFLPVWIGMEAV